MKEDISYNELVAALKDPSNPLFGGSLAYINIELNLALLIKLLKIKAEKDEANRSSYKKIITISEAITSTSHQMITKDSEIFSSLRFATSCEDKNKIVLEVFPSSQAFIENLNTIDFYLTSLSEITTGSIKNDYVMIQKNIRSCKDNLKTILLYEVKKLSIEDTKAKFIDIIDML